MAYDMKLLTDAVRAHKRPTGKANPSTRKLTREECLWWKEHWPEKKAEWDRIMAEFDAGFQAIKKQYQERKKQLTEKHDRIMAELESDEAFSEQVDICASCEKWRL